MIGPANDVRDAHVDIVHDDAQLIRGAAVHLALLGRAQKNEILNLIVGNFARTENGVLELRDRAERDAETNRRVFSAKSGFALAARAARDAARTLLFFRVIGFLDRIAATALFFPAQAIAKISRARRGQLQRRLTMQIQAL